MPRYLVERVWEPLDEDELRRLGLVSSKLIEESFPDLTWVRTHVVSDADGDIRTFCVYEAPNSSRIHEHSGILGCHRIDNIYEIVGDLEPADFPG